MNKPFILLVLSVLFDPSVEHGALHQPAGRNSAWRFGFDTPPDYTDNEENCGGYSRQWISNDGKCGECGDPWDVPLGQRTNQAGGLYATGTIVGHYSPGEVIDVVVHIDANHKGWYQFRLCPVNNPTVAATWQCFNETLLEFEDGTTKYYPDAGRLGDIPHRVRLPEHITCSQCVFQWLWHCGNNFNKFPNGTECVGCGPQEQFYGCADIAILGDAVSTTEGTPGTTIPMTTNPTTTTTTGPTTTTTPGTTTTRPEGGFDCEYTGLNFNKEEMDMWCNDNCNHEPCYCPSDCSCTPGRPC